MKGLVTQTSKLTPPKSGSIPVAILISECLNVIDFSGPWGVFESVNVPGATEPPFRFFTVAETADIVTSGSGLKLMPDYTFANVPEVKVVVIPAQKGSEAMIEWLRKIAPTADVTMSVCTGAFKLAKAGLLSGKAATTHHEFLDKLQSEYPDIQVKRGVRFVEGEKISTAGGPNEWNRSRAPCGRALLRARGRANDGDLHGVPREGLDRLRSLARLFGVGRGRPGIVKRSVEPLQTKRLR